MNKLPASPAFRSFCTKAAHKPWLENVSASVVLKSIAWDRLIEDLVACGGNEFSLNQCAELQCIKDFIYIDRHKLLLVLKACGRLNLIAHGQQAHAALVEQGHVLDCYSGTILVCMYGKWGMLDEAEYIVYQIKFRNVIVWTSLIGACADHGHNSKALDCKKRMSGEGILPNQVTFICTVKACGDMRASDECLRIHEEVVELGFDQDTFVGSALVDAYSKSGCLSEAQKALDALSCLDSIALTPLLVSYAEHGLPDEAINCWKRILEEKLYLDAVTFKCSLKACGSTRCLDWGRKVHIEIVKRGMETNLQIYNVLVDMYAKCGSLTESEILFCSMPHRDVVSYNTLMHAYAERDLFFKLNDCFTQMCHAGLLPTGVTFVCCLNACENIEKGQKMHLEFIKLGFEGNLYATSSLVDMYAKFGSFAEALKVFSGLSVRNTVSWTALLRGYADHNLGEEAMLMFGKMIWEAVPVDAVTFFCALKVCEENTSLVRGQELHAFITSEGLETDPYIGSILVAMYTSCGFLKDAEEVINTLVVPIVASWTALSLGYAKNGLAVEAVDCLKKIQLECWPMNATAFACSLRLCGSIGVLTVGFMLHAKLVKEGLDMDCLVKKALIDFYGKCGLLLESQNVFDSLLETDNVSWTVLITNFSWCAVYNSQLFSLLHRMEKQGVEPDNVTFLGLLTACSHFGLVDDGQVFFVYMCRDYSIAPNIDHFNCLVDIYSRGGQFDSVAVVLHMMPFQPDRSTCHTILSACRKGGDIELCRQTFQNALMLDDIPHVALLLLLGIYAETDL